jgi:hypothetical protein
LEGPEQKEATDPLMLCVSALGKEPYERARASVVELLRGIYRDYDRFALGQGKAAPKVKVCLHEGGREGGR